MCCRPISSKSPSGKEGRCGLRLVDEDKRSVIDDPELIHELWQTAWGGNDVAACWVGQYLPDSPIASKEASDMVKWSTDHYNIYSNFVQFYMEKRGSVLDVGCGNGHRTRMLRRYADLVLGVDNDPLKLVSAVVHHSAPGCAFIGCDFLDPLLGGQFGYIFMIEVMEHVEFAEQNKWVNKGLAMLQPGGRLFITTPRDPAPKREPPHIGLWDDGIFNSLKATYSSMVLASGFMAASHSEPGADLRKESALDATHYFVVLQRLP